MKYILVTLLLGISIYACTENANPKGVPIDYARIEKSTRAAMSFLKGCSYLKSEYPQAYINLHYIKEIKIDFDMSDNTFCGVWSPSNMTIILFRPALENAPGCYGSLHYVIAHELLHRIGLPNHKGDQRENFKNYLETDEIEITMRECASER